MTGTGLTIVECGQGTAMGNDKDTIGRRAADGAQTAKAASARETGKEACFCFRFVFRVAWLKGKESVCSVM